MRADLDPKPTIGISDYASFNNNPILNTDILGDTLSPTAAAAITAHVYGDKSDKILIEGWSVSSRNFGIAKNAESGLKSQVYEKTVNGVTEYTYATAGTENWEDMKADAIQPLGVSTQYKQSMFNANKISEQLGTKTELSFTGHSLGGGLAAANAFRTGRNATTFNAAGVSSSTIGVNSASKIIAFIMDTDPLNGTQNNNTRASIGNGMPDVNGVRTYIRASNMSSLFNGHSMDNILIELGVKALFKEFTRRTPSGLDNYPAKPYIPTSN